MTAPRPVRKYRPDNPFAPRFDDVEGGSSSATVVDPRVARDQAMLTYLRGDTPEQRENFDAFAHGATFGFNDEIEGGVNAATGGADYRIERKAARARIDPAVQKHPGMVLAGSIASSAVPVGGALGRAASWMGRVGAGAVSGAVAGGLYGAGAARELEDVPVDAWTEAGKGALVGGVIPAAAGSLRFLTSRQAAGMYEAMLADAGASSQRSVRSGGRSLLAIAPAVRDELSQVSAMDLADFLTRGSVGKAWQIGRFARNVLRRAGGEASDRSNALADALDDIATSTADARAPWPEMAPPRPNGAVRASVVRRAAESTGLDEAVRASVERNQMPHGVIVSRNPRTGQVTYGWPAGSNVPRDMKDAELLDAVRFYTDTDLGRQAPEIGMRLRAEVERRIEAGTLRGRPE